ncbi:ShlB/FhaC/HecB family hemolysin secretion/activation protein [Geopseudomonas aromaticivorans]
MHLRAILAGLLVGCLASQALAASNETPGDRDLIRDRQQRLLEEQQRRLEELQQLPGKSSAEPRQPVRPDERCFDIHDITLQGASLIDEATREHLLAPFIGKCLGAGQLNGLLKAITDFYLDRGYVTTRAYLPQQDLSDGSLEVLVIEGRLEGLDSSELASERELAMAFPGKPGEILDLRELEQLVDQLGRLPSRQAQLELLPGEAVGGSRVQLAGQREKPWRVSFNRHNDGQSSSGEQQWGVGLDWDSPLGLADQISLRGGGDTVSDHWRHSANQSLLYSLPYGWWTFNYSYSQSYYRSLAEANGFDFHTDGENRSHALRAERVLHRDSVGKTAINVGLSHVRTRNYIENTLLDASSNRISEFQLGFNHGRRIGTAFVNLDLGWQRGIGALDAQDNGHPLPGEPVARYNKYSLTLSYLQPFQLWGELFSFDSLVTGQKSEDVLFSPQRISIGGLSSVRGFKEQSLSGDSGGYWRNQLRWRRPVTVETLRPWLGEYGMTLAYDAGVISGGRYNRGMSGRMSGQAIELYARGQHLATSVTWAQSLERPDAFAEAEHPLYFRVDLYF